MPPAARSVPDSAVRRPDAQRTPAVTTDPVRPDPELDRLHPYTSRQGLVRVRASGIDCARLAPGIPAYTPLAGVPAAYFAGAMTLTRHLALQHLVDALA